MFDQHKKGKEKASQDAWGINPEITYRHILAKVPSVYNPLRVIALIDNDAFYASAERVRLGLSDDIPLVVQQWQALIAVSYKAREYGIKRMDTVIEAKKKCPELVAVHTATYREGDVEPAYHENPDVRTHKVSLDHYRRESKKIYEMYKETLPIGGEIEKASIDECFFDLTLPVRDTLIQRYPTLAQLPPDAPLGLDTPLPSPSSLGIDVHGTFSWDGLGNIVPVLRSEAMRVGDRGDKEKETKVAEEEAGGHEDPGSNKEIIEDTSAEDEHELTWGDIALAIGAEMSMHMRMEVKTRLGYTTSGGIARNKVLAKLVASYRKRDTQTVLRNAAIPGYWRPMPFQKIRFLGGKMGEILANAFEVDTVGELEYLTLEEMQSKFGEESIWVWNVLRGIDHTEVSDKIASKSMLSSKNIRPPVIKVEDGDRWLRMLSGDLALRLQEAREITPTLWPKTLTIGIKQDSDPRQSRQTPFPYTRTITPSYVHTLALKLWKEITIGKQMHSKIHNIALSFHGLNDVGAGQKSIEGFFDVGGDNGSGSDGGVVGMGKKKRTRDMMTVTDDDENFSFVCDQCRKTIRLPSSVIRSFKKDSGGGYGAELEESERQRLIENLRAEHADYHFAKSLAHTVSDTEDAADPPINKKKKANGTGNDKKKKEVPKGIAKYFTAGAGPSNRKGKGE